MKHFVIFLRKILFLVFMSFVISNGLYAQRSIEFTIGSGATAVNLDELVDVDEVEGARVTDWSVFNMGLGGQYFLAQKKSVLIGAELMYHYLYWYSVEVPYGISPIYREYNVSALRIAPIARFSLNEKFKIDLGPELNFMDGISPGILVSANYYLHVNQKITVPFKFRMDIIRHIVLLAPVSLNVGVNINLEK